MNIPFVGPRPFDAEDQDIFFGRNAELDELLSIIIAHRVILLYAASGAGKTSLLNAKLIPRLKDEGFEVLPVARVRDIASDSVTKNPPNIFIYNALIGLDREMMGEDSYLSMKLHEFLDQRNRAIDEYGFDKPRILVFDQFEELFIHYTERWKDRQDFFEQIKISLTREPSLKVIFSLREDYLAYLDSFSSTYLEESRIRFRLERLRRNAALEAIQKPLELVGYSFDVGVADQLVDDLLRTKITNLDGETVEVLGEYVEPVQLQVVCQNLWENLPPNTKIITSDNFEEVGDTNKVLADFYEANVKAAAKKGKVAEISLRESIENAFITPIGTRALVYRGKETTGGIPNAIIDILQDNHLIGSEWRAGARWYELTHDRFIDPILNSNKNEFLKSKNEFLKSSYTPIWPVPLMLFANAVIVVVLAFLLANRVVLRCISPPEVSVLSATVILTVVFHVVWRYIYYAFIPQNYKDTIKETVQVGFITIPLSYLITFFNEIHPWKLPSRLLVFLLLVLVAAGAFLNLSSYSLFYVEDEPSPQGFSIERLDNPPERLAINQSLMIKAGEKVFVEAILLGGVEASCTWFNLTGSKIEQKDCSIVFGARPGVENDVLTVFVQPACGTRQESINLPIVVQQ